MRDKKETMEHYEYWLECLNSSLDETGNFDKISDEDKIQIAKDLQMGHEMIGMTFYTPPPSDRINKVEQDLKDRIKQLEKELYNSDLNFRKNVARRHHCEITDVTIKDNGEAYIY